MLVFLLFAAMLGAQSATWDHGNIHQLNEEELAEAAHGYFYAYTYKTKEYLKQIKSLISKDPDLSLTITESFTTDHDTPVFITDRIAQIEYSLRNKERHVANRYQIQWNEHTIVYHELSQVLKFFRDEKRWKNMESFLNECH